MGRMSWEGEPQLAFQAEWVPEFTLWWQHVLETDWATDRMIMYTCGPEYYFAFRETAN